MHPSRRPAQPRSVRQHTPKEKGLSDIPPCTECRKAMTDFHPYDDYMLTPELWAKIHPEGYKGLLCHVCLAARALRQSHVFTRADFKPCLCYVNRIVQPQAITIAQIARSAKATMLSQMINAQMRRIVNAGSPILPPYLIHLSRV